MEKNCKNKFICLTDCSSYDKIISSINSVMHIQLTEPALKSDDYMRGLANGMILIESIIKGIQPLFFNKDGSRDAKRS